MKNLENLLCAELKRQLETKGAHAVRIPAGGELLWRWFLDLGQTRTYHMAGPNPISFVEIEAYARQMRWPLEPHHIDILRAMDAAWLEHASKRAQPAPQGVKVLPQVSATPLTAGLVDAVFGGR